MALPRLAHASPKLGLALAAELAAVGPSSTASAAAAATAAVSLPFIAVHVRRDIWVAKANASEGGCCASRIDAASVAERNQRPEGAWAEALSILSAFHPKSLIITLSKHFFLQSLLRFNQYMMLLLDYEERRSDAEEQGQAVPDPPKLPDFKPGFTVALRNSIREVSVTVVRKVYEIVAVRRLGFARAQPFLRDYKNWIKDVLSKKHRLDPASVRFTKYTFATLHGTALFYAAECTVSVIQLMYNTSKHPTKNRAGKALTIARGTIAQVTVCTVRYFATSTGVALCTILLWPGYGASLGNLVFDLGATVVAAPLIPLITGL